MLHEARMNFQRTIVNQAPRFPCRGAAQFNKPDAANPAMAPWLTIKDQWRRVADLGRSAS